MSRLKAQIIWGMLTIATLTEGILAYGVNTTIYDTNLAHITYSDTAIRCNHWVDNWMFKKVCKSWLKPWTSGVYYAQGKKWTSHSSLNHQLASVTIEFKGTDVWVYGPPLGQLTELPPDYKICLYENYHISSKNQCYQTNITEAYWVNKDEDQPVVIFARGQLPNHEHRIVISVADPVDNLQAPLQEDHWRYREVVMHDTHPLLSYSPPISSNQRSKPPAWFAKVHTAEDGTVTTWHEFKSRNEGNQWGISTKVKAGAIAIYGAPRAFIRSPDNLGFVCVRLGLGLCETVDLRTIYANQGSNAQQEPVLLWRDDALVPSHETLVSIRLVKLQTGAETIFPFKSINYFEVKEYASPGSIVAKFENVTVNHDDEAISYNPNRRCSNSSLPGTCRNWIDFWVQKEVGPSGSVLTYRSTLAQYRVKEDPHITLNFRGSAVYLYGAPDVYAERPFAPQHVCINNACRVIDIEQAYLHPPRRYMESASIRNPQGPESIVQDIIAPFSVPHPELEPVLIWSITGLDDRLEHTLRLALAELPAPVNAEMTFVKAVYTRIDYLYGDRPDSPAPELDPAYIGPLCPPHAAKWASLDHRPLPPPLISTDPPPSQPVFFPLFLLALFMTWLFLPPVIRFLRRTTRELKPFSFDYLPLPQSPLPQDQEQGFSPTFNEHNVSPNDPDNPWGSHTYSPPPRNLNIAESSTTWQQHANAQPSGAEFIRDQYSASL